MKKRVDETVGRSFALAAGVLMTSVFPEVRPNRRPLAFACRPASPSEMSVSADPACAACAVRHRGSRAPSGKGMEGAKGDLRSRTA